jgi:hypothetical protein
MRTRKSYWRDKSRHLKASLALSEPQILREFDNDHAVWKIKGPTLLSLLCKIKTIVYKYPDLLRCIAEFNIIKELKKADVDKLSASINLQNTRI